MNDCYWEQGESQLHALDNYKNAWLLDDALHMHLKYTSARACQQAGAVKSHQPTRASPRKKVTFGEAVGGSS
jgi:hypothetical protein